MTCNPEQLLRLLSRTIPAHLPTLTLGAPGTGKSALHEQAAKAAGYEYKVLYPALLDPVDMGGLPIPIGDGDNRRVKRLLDDTLLMLCKSKLPTLLLLDELGQASPAMQAACAPLMLVREIGGHRLPENITITAATNRRSDRSGATAILTHLISRMSTVVELKSDIGSWTVWATKAKIRPEIISYIRWRPSLLHQYDAEAAWNGTTPYPCPRSWENASMLLEAGLDQEVERIALDGCVGEGAATELITHIRLARNNISADEILAAPEKFQLPKSIGEQYAIVSALAHYATADKYAALLDIADILSKKSKELSAMLLRDALNIHPGIHLTPEWMRAMSGPLGSMILGA